jgi:heme exporter protein CcmD
MNTWSQALHMGGYAAYVWSAYGFVCTTLVVALWGLRRQRSQIQKNLKQWFSRN